MRLPARLKPVLPLCTFLTAGCWNASASRASADLQVYPILEQAAELVTGEAKTFSIDRPVDTLRQRLLTSSEPVHLTLVQALDVAAENSREFQRQKESLYLAALSLTRQQHDFALRFSGGGAGDVEGQADDTANVFLADDLSASVNTVAGTRVVVSFVNTFLRSLIGGGGFDGSSILDITLTQPLLRGSGERIVREPLTQAERDVIYQMRSFERFRATFAVSVVGQYLNVVQQIEDLKNVDANYESRRQGRIRTEEEFNAGRRTIIELGRDQQSELTAELSRVSTRNRLETSLDNFKLTLGLPVKANIELDARALERLAESGVVPFELDEDEAVALALSRRYDHATVLDGVEDASRRVAVSEDALGMSLDFTSALTVPSEPGRGLDLDWSRVNWSAGFDLDLALDKLVERNAYRQALINLDLQIRNREASADEITADIRAALRDIQSAYDSYRINVEALRVAATRVESTGELYAAGRTQAIELEAAKDSLLSSQLSVTAALVDYTLARIALVRDLEGLVLEPRGLRFDPALPLPEPAAEEQP